MSTEPSRRLFVPEIVQTSQMDCGPAALKAIAQGLGIHLSYPRLREACQTTIDGTSIDTLEQVAGQLGLGAEQIMMPLDHVGERSSETFPSIVVLRLRSGAHHFVVLWRRHGRFVQVMDPAAGRRWLSLDDFRGELLTHTHELPAEDVGEYLAAGTFTEALAGRFRALGIGARAAEAHRARAACSGAGWFAHAALDAAVRLVDAVVASGGLSRGAQADRAVGALSARAVELGVERHGEAIPDEFWFAFPAFDEQGALREDRVLVRGAVLVSVKGGGKGRALADGGGEENAPAEAPKLSAELAATIGEGTPSVLAFLRELAVRDKLTLYAIALVASVVCALTALLQALILRAMLDVAPRLAEGVQRASALAVFVVFLMISVAMEAGLALVHARIGRHLEVRFRSAFLDRLRTLPDRYFRSRLTSDLAERAHVLQAVRAFPSLLLRLVRGMAGLVATCAGVFWLSPSAWPWTLGLVLLGLLGPFIVQPIVMERDMRLRTYEGAVTRFYLDAMMGLVPIRAHRAERSMRREHEGLVVDLVTAARRLLSLQAASDAVLALVGLVLSTMLFREHLAQPNTSGASALLLVFWVLQVPGLATQIAQSLRQYPPLRNTLARLLEPMTAPVEYEGELAALPAAVSSGVALEYRDVKVTVPGVTLLEDVSLKIAAGSHVAIVGPSGAGKSTLVGLLLGWLRPAAGEIRVDGAALEPSLLPALRAATAWVDPQVQLWNRSVLDNIRFGGSRGSKDVADAVNGAALLDTMARLPSGLQTDVGETGVLLSGGEGQRIRFARAWMRPDARLVILDEPFRGLARQQRAELFASAREHWKAATMLCVTHDVAETTSFGRVLVVEDGKVVEDGAPADLLARPSRYRALVEADRSIMHRLLASAAWRRVAVTGGVVEEAS
jgi:ATP-binding cassette subfamily B protein